MSISHNKNLDIQNKIKQVVSLQVQTIPPKKKSICKKWMSRSASLTIEAAFSLLLFLFASLSLIYPLYIMGMQEHIQQALERVGDELTEASYLAQDLEANPHIVSIMSTFYVKNRVISLLSQEQIPTSLIDGGEGGLSFWESSIMADGKTVDLIVRYKVKMPFPFLSLKNLSFVQRSRRRGWVGEEIRAEGEDELQVYVTDHGIAYHKSLSCKHLKNDIQQISNKDVETLRNENGGKYYPCEVCKPDQNSGSFYVTKYGSRYHKSVSCRELSISISSVPISETGSRTPCKSCYAE